MTDAIQNLFCKLQLIKTNGLAAESIGEIVKNGLTEGK